jgi:hypothetical protein
LVDFEIMGQNIDSLVDLGLLYFEVGVVVDITDIESVVEIGFVAEVVVVIEVGVGVVAGAEAVVGVEGS